MINKHFYPGVGNISGFYNIKLFILAINERHLKKDHFKVCNTWNTFPSFPA